MSALPFSASGWAGLTPWLASLTSLEFRRKRLLARSPAGPLREFLSRPFADPHLDYRQACFLAMDLETTGLNSEQDHILSVGTVEIHGDAIDLGTARHQLVHSSQPLPEESVVIHRITDDLSAQGDTIRHIVESLLEQLAGKVLLAHHARIETGFLRSACQRLFGGELLLPVVDTLRLAHRQLRQRNAVFSSEDLRLGALREHYHLPRYPAHNALSDAIAAGELFLAQAAERSGSRALPLKRLLAPY